MSDATIDEGIGREVSRRRFIAGTSAATAAIWVAPTVTGLDARAFAQGSECPPIFTDSIQTAPSGLSQTGSVGGFSVVSGNVDVIGGPGNPFASLVPPGYTKAIDLDGTGNSSPNVQLATPSLPAGDYTVSVTLAGDRRNDNDNTVAVTFQLGGLTQSLASADGPTTYQFDATQAVSGPATITHNSGAFADNIGILLLAMVVRPKVCTAV